MCFVDMKEAFDRVSRNVVEWEMRRKGIPELLVAAVMNVHKGGNTKVKVGTHLSEELEVNVGVHQGSVLSLQLLAIVIDVPTNDIK